jgi:hypothetical protein
MSIRYYAEQMAGFGLGNFINLTPAIKALSEFTENKKVQVWFHDAFIRKCFINCPFMEIVSFRQRRPILHSGMVNYKNDMPDYLYVWKNIFPSNECREHTYVDEPTEFNDDKTEFAVIINGSGSRDPNYINKKNPSVEAYQHLISQLPVKMKKVFVGSASDALRMTGIYFDVTRTENIRMALHYISKAQVVIANDSGLAHAAGAMNKKLFLLWKDTLLPKNINPGKQTVVIRKEEWCNYKIEN